MVMRYGDTFCRRSNTFHARHDWGTRQGMRRGPISLGGKIAIPYAGSHTSHVFTQTKSEWATWGRQVFSLCFSFYFLCGIGALSHALLLRHGHAVARHPFHFLLVGRENRNISRCILGEGQLCSRRKKKKRPYLDLKPKSCAPIQSFPIASMSNSKANTGQISEACGPQAASLTCLP